MKNWKKALSAIITAAVMSVGVATAVGCGGDDDHVHTYKTTWSSDDNNHWHDSDCDHPDEVSDFGAHKDTNKDGKCDTCGHAVPVPHEHTWATTWSSDDNKHWHAATCEGHTDQKKDEADHVDANNDGKCDVCEHDVEVTPPPHEHTWATTWSSDDNKHWHAATCEGHTSEKKDEANHVDTDNDGKCDVCEHDVEVTPPPHEHTWATTWSSDDDQHWHAATCEGHTSEKKDAADHVDADNNGKCDVCDHDVDVVVTPPHEHTWADTWSKDENGHWHAATCEGHTSEKKDEAGHTDANNDGKCDVCEYVISEPGHEHTWADTWSKDGSKHWKESTCQDHAAIRKDEADHVNETGDDELCDVCGQDMHQHTWADTWSKDANGHWHAATCEGHTSEKKDEANHTDGNGDFICDTCQYVMHTHSYVDAWSYDKHGHWHASDCGHTDETSGYAEHVLDGDGKCETCDFEAAPDVVVNIADLQSKISSSKLANGTQLGEGLELVGDHKANSSGGKKPLVNGTAIDGAGYRLQLEKMTKDGTSGIKVTLSAPATILVYANSNGSDVRQLGLYSTFTGESVDEITALQTCGIGVFSNELDTALFEVESAGTYYIGASDTVNIFYIIVSFKDIPEQATHVEGKTANCTEAGNIDYYKTNYGRYYTLSGETKTYISIQTVHAGDVEALGHLYNTTNYSVTLTPTATATGKVTLTCAREGDTDHSDVFDLPKLDSSDYTRSGTEGTITYTIKVENVNVSFEAGYVAPDTTIYQTFNVSSLDVESSNGKRDYTTGCTFFSLTTNTTNDYNKNAAVKTANASNISATALNGTTLNFTKGILPSGTGGRYVIKNTAGKQITLVVYYTICDGTFDAAGGKSLTTSEYNDTLKYVIGSGSEQSATNTSKITGAAVVTLQVTLNANETLEVYTASNRLIVYGIGAMDKVV